MRRAAFGIVLASGWLGCNALIGNKDAYLVDDPDGATLVDGAVAGEGGGSGEGGGELDGAPTDGPSPDAPVGSCPGCSVVASGFRSGRAIVIDGSYVYYAADDALGSSNSIWRIPRAGGTPAAVAANVADPISTIAVGNGKVYFAVEQAQGWLILQVPVGGGTPLEYAKRNIDTGPVSQIRVTSDRVVWNFEVDGTYWSCDFTCNPDPTDFFVFSTGRARGFDVTGSTIYFGYAGSAGSSYIGRCPSPATPTNCNNAGPPEYTRQKVDAPGQLVVRDGRVFWVDSGLRINRGLTSGGPNAAAIEIANSSSPITSVDADATHVYWASSDGRIMKAPADGGGAQPTELAAQQGTAVRIAARDSEIFWLTNNQLVKRAK